MAEDKTQGEVDAMTVAEFDQYHADMLSRLAMSFYTGPRCGTCRLFQGPRSVRLACGDFEDYFEDTDSDGTGRCFRFPPVLISSSEGDDTYQRWDQPRVDINHGCGEHQPRSE